MSDLGKTASNGLAISRRDALGGLARGFGIAASAALLQTVVPVAVSGAADVPATDIEDLLRWAYQIEGVETKTLRRSGAYMTGSGSAKIPPIHPDAAAVHEMVMEMSRMAPEASILVRVHAADGSHPDWIPEGIRFRPVIDRRDKARVDAIEYGPGYVASFSPIRVDNSPEVIAFHRAQYTVWWAALDALAAQLRAEPHQLVAHHVTGPAAPAAPWMA